LSRFSQETQQGLMFCFYDLTSMLLAAVGKRGVDEGALSKNKNTFISPLKQNRSL